MFLGQLVMCIQSAMAAHLNHDWPAGQRVLIAGYEDRPHLYLVTTEAIGGYPPLAPLPIRTHMISGRSEAIDREIAKGVTLDSMGRIIRAQHADCLLEGNWPLAGKVTRARVSAEGVELVEVDELPVPERIRTMRGGVTGALGCRPYPMRVGTCAGVTRKSTIMLLSARRKTLPTIAPLLAGYASVRLVAWGRGLALRDRVNYIRMGRRTIKSAGCDKSTEN